MQVFVRYSSGLLAESAGSAALLLISIFVILVILICPRWTGRVLWRLWRVGLAAIVAIAVIVFVHVLRVFLMVLAAGGWDGLMRVFERVPAP